MLNWVILFLKICHNVVVAGAATVADVVVTVSVATVLVAANVNHTSACTDNYI
jgi:hypothetical protein